MSDPNCNDNGWGHSPDSELGTDWIYSNNWQPDNLKNGYQENPNQANFFDTPYSETFANPDGQQKQSSGWEIE